VILKDQDVTHGKKGDYRPAKRPRLPNERKNIRTPLATVGVSFFFKPCISSFPSQNLLTRRIFRNKSLSSKVQ
jgi:hypothetical protein